MNTPIPPRRPAQAEIDQLAATQARPAAPAVNNEGPMDLLGGLSSLGPEVGMFLQDLFGKAFGGQPSYPGYSWDALEGWVPDAAAQPKVAAPAASAPKPAAPAPLPPRRPESF